MIYAAFVPETMDHAVQSVVSDKSSSLKDLVR